MDNDDGWVTDPDALHTAVALNALRAGDEILLQRCAETFIPLDREGTIATIEGVERDSSPHIYGEEGEKREYIALGFILSGGYWFYAENIRAWRPQRG